MEGRTERRENGRGERNRQRKEEKRKQRETDKASEEGEKRRGKNRDKVTEELWMEIHNIVQEAVTKTIPNEKKCKRAKWLSEEALQIAEKRREAKGRKGKIYPNECKRITRRDKKTFLSE